MKKMNSFNKRPATPREVSTFIKLDYKWSQIAERLDDYNPLSARSLVEEYTKNVDDDFVESVYYLLTEE